MSQLKMLLIVVITSIIFSLGIGAKPVQAVTFDFNWKGNAGYAAQGSFSYDETKDYSAITKNQLESLKISFFDPSSNLLKSYVNVENGKDTRINSYLEFNFNPITQSLTGAFDVGEGNLIGENDFYLQGVINDHFELRNLDTNVLDSNSGVMNIGTRD